MGGRLASDLAVWAVPLQTDGEPILPGERDRILDPLYEALGVTPPWIVDLLVALLVLVLAWHLANVVVRYAGRPVAQRFERPSLTQAVLQAIRVTVLTVAAVVAALIVGLQPSELALSVTIFTAILAVVLAPLVGRFISGFFVLADRPFEIGDLVELGDGGMRGYVEDVTLRYTKLFTVDNTFIVVPNSTMVERDVINFSAEDERTRQRIEVVVTYEGDVDEARHLLERSAREVDGVIASGPPIRVGSALYPATPTSRIDDFGDHGILLVLRYWVREPYRLPMIRGRVQERFWDAITDADVEIAYPHQHLFFDETTGELPVGIRDRPSSDDTPEHEPR